MGEGFSDAAGWAASVKPTEPHDLAELERHVLGSGTGSAARQAAERKSSPIDLVVFAVAVLLLLGPLAAATVFWDRSDAVRLSYSFSDEFAFPVAAVGCTLGSVLVVLALVDHFRKPRQRDPGLIAISLVVAACAVLALVSATGRGYAGPITIYVGLMGLSAVLGLLGAGVGATGPARDRSEVKAERAHRRLHQAKIVVANQGVDNLHPGLKKILLDDRRRALEILQSRGLLTDDAEVSTLASKPLGQLATNAGETS